MKRRLGWLVCALVALCLAIPASHADDASETAFVLNPKPEDRLNLRATPSTSAKSLGRFYNGANLEVLGQEGDFTKVRVGSLTGFMQRKFLSDAWSDGKLPEVSFATVVNPGDNERLQLRTEPKANAASLGNYPTGTVVQVLGAEGEYLHVRMAEADGYMLAAFLQRDGQPGKLHPVQLNTGLLLKADQPLRTFPDANAPVIVKMKDENRKISILGVAGTWYYVEYVDFSLPERMRGFVQGRMLMPAEDIEYVDGEYLGEWSPPGNYAAVRLSNEKDRLTLRDAPSQTAKVLDLYLNNTQMELLGGDAPYEPLNPESKEHPAGWSQVRVDGVEGYVPAEGLIVISRGNTGNW